MPARSRVDIADPGYWFEHSRSGAKLQCEEGVTSPCVHARTKRGAEKICVLPLIQGASERWLELDAHAWRHRYTKKEAAAPRCPPGLKGFRPRLGQKSHCPADVRTRLRVSDRRASECQDGTKNKCGMRRNNTKPCPLRHG